ncbi:MAG: hypothetical protein MI923_30375 [Phycisphaerales bacterium]|nr:hypothetical protein [Phycisphaerales bacterium]
MKHIKVFVICLVAAFTMSGMICDQEQTPIGQIVLPQVSFCVQYSNTTQNNVVFDTQDRDGVSAGTVTVVPREITRGVFLNVSPVFTLSAVPPVTFKAGGWGDCVVLSPNGAGFVYVIDANPGNQALVCSEQQSTACPNPQPPQ